MSLSTSCHVGARSVCSCLRQMTCSAPQGPPVILHPLSPTDPTRGPHHVCMCVFTCLCRGVCVLWLHHAGHCLPLYCEQGCECIGVLLFFYSIFSFLPQINRRRAGTYPETHSTLDVKIAPHRQRLRPVSRGVVKNGTHAELFKMHKKVSWRYALNPTESWKPPFWHFTPVFSSRQQRSEMHFPPSVWPSFSWTYSSQHNMSASVRQMMQFQQALAGVCVFMCLWLTTSPMNLGANLLT